MSNVFHAGELAVQTQAGVTAMEARVGRGIMPLIPPGFQAFLAGQSYAVVAAAQSDGRLQVTFVTGAPGFLSVPDPHHLKLTAALPLGFEPLVPRGNVSLLVIDLASRERIRINGHLEGDDPGGLTLEVAEVYGNCPKYIQARRPGSRTAPAAVGTAALGPVQQTLSLTQQALIRACDTFFIATSALGRADVSHRGGPPGFVQLCGNRHLSVADYPGNTMFNTIGNLAVNPQVSLLVPDFREGRTLHLRGTAEVVWISPETRTVEIELTEVAEQNGTLPVHWIFLGSSPFNPAPVAVLLEAHSTGEVCR